MVTSRREELNEKAAYWKREIAPQIQHLWTEQDSPKAMGETLVHTAMKRRSQTSGRRARALAQIRAYEDLELQSLDSEDVEASIAEERDLPSHPVDGDPEDYVQTHNVAGRAMDAIDAKIFALEKTKCRFVVNQGGWKLKTAAVMGGRFIDATMRDRTGLFPDLWHAWRHAARISTIGTGAAAMFFFPDFKQGKIVTELDNTLDMWMDGTGLVYDGFSSIGRVTFWDPEKLAVQFPDDKTAIYEAVDAWNKLRDEYRNEWPDEWVDEDQALVRVPLVAGWKMQYAGGADKGGIDGVECFSVPGKTLAVNPWKHDDPPCVIFNPFRRLNGKWGRTVMERSMPANRRYNEILNSGDRAERTTAKREVYYREGTVDIDNIRTVHDVKYVPFTGDMSQLPVETTPKPVDVQAHEFFLNLHRDAVYNLPGLNEAHATMDLGKTMSGVAIRLVKNEIYEIFAPLEDELTRCSGPESGKQIIRCARELQRELGGGYRAVWRPQAPKGEKAPGWMMEIGADVFETLEQARYEIEAESVSGTANTPADNVATAKELMETGVITGEAYAQILQTFNAHGGKNPLTEAEERIADRMVDLWLYGLVEDFAKKTLDPELWMDRGGGMTLKIGAEYLNARVDMIEDMDDPEVGRRLQAFKDYMKKLTDNAAERQQLAAQAQAAAQGAQQPQQAAPAA